VASSDRPSDRPDLASLSATRSQPDIAIIDVRLADGNSGINAAVELSKSIRLGILFATGHAQQVLDPPALRGEACLMKPFTGPELIEALKIVERIVTTGEPPAILPPKVRLIRRGAS
jgi:CheY-like chemotaxis protein